MISPGDIADHAVFNPNLAAIISCRNTLMFRFGMVDLYELVQIHESDNAPHNRLAMKLSGIASPS